jgi:hypothetical protein
MLDQLKEEKRISNQIQGEYPSTGRTKAGVPCINAREQEDVPPWTPKKQEDEMMWREETKGRGWPGFMRATRFGQRSHPPFRDQQTGRVDQHAYARDIRDGTRLKGSFFGTDLNSQWEI